MCISEVKRTWGKLITCYSDSQDKTFQMLDMAFGGAQAIHATKLLDLRNLRNVSPKSLQVLSCFFFVFS